MKFVSLITAALVCALPALAQTTEFLTYDPTYDNATLSLNSVACSNGVNGLYTRNYTTLGSLPTFPYVGGAYTVTGWNSTECGSCYQITYTAPNGTTTSINATAVDTADVGFNLSEESIIKLAGELGIQLGRINVTSVQVNASVCGL